MNTEEMKAVESLYRKCADILMDIRIKDEVLTEIDVDNANLYGKILKQRNDMWDKFKRISHALSVSHALATHQHMVSLAEEFYG